MKEKLPLTLSVAILCFISVYVCGLEAVAPYAPTYAVFLTWASYFTAGGGYKGLKTSIITNCMGALWGFIGVVVFTPIFGFTGSFALATAIFFVGGFMVIESVIPALAFVPGCFIGCATFFSVANSALVGPKGPTSILIATVIGALVGNVLGIGSNHLADFIERLGKKK